MLCILLMHCYCIDSAGGFLDELSNLLQDEGGDFSLVKSCMMVVN